MINIKEVIATNKRNRKTVEDVIQDTVAELYQSHAINISFKREHLVEGLRLSAQMIKMSQQYLYKNQDPLIAPVLTFNVHCTEYKMKCLTLTTRRVDDENQSFTEIYEDIMSTEPRDRLEDLYHYSN